MKIKLKSALLTLTLVAAMACQSFAADVKDIAIGTSNEIEMLGTIEPTIISVTMPASIPFHMSNSVTAENKVVSPRIPIVNNSTVAVKVNIIYTKVDLSSMKNTVWSDTGAVADNEISIGFKKETELNKLPSNLSQAKWLSANKAQNLELISLNATETGIMYVVGAMGSKIDENASFSVIPTLVVSR